MRQPVPFGKYLLLERVSVGGMAEVFKAKAFGVEGFEKILAIKRILPSMAEDADFIQMFIDEAKIAGQLNHANIAQIFELGRVDDSHFIAMEYVWGKDLLQIQNRFRRVKSTMPFPMAAFCAAKMCEGLDYAHKKKDAGGKLLGIIHRDVSPQNVLCSYDGEIKVIDFGIAKAASRSTKTQAGVLKGKFGYMSPEQVRGLPLDRRSDVFAIATILYELLTAERLFLGESDFATLEKVRNVDVPAPSKVVPTCPEPIEKIILKGLAKDVEDRYQWASEMQEDLQSYLNTLDPPFGLKQLAGWMREQFAPEIKRESQVLEEQKKLTREMKAPALAQAMASSPGAMAAGGALSARPATQEIKVEDLALDDLLGDEASMPGEATQISSELPPEVLAVIAAQAAAAAEAKPLAGESTQILDANHPSPSQMPSQATQILDTGGNGAAAGLPPLQGQSTVMLDSPVYPPPRVLPDRADKTGQTALNPETSQVDGLPFRGGRRSSIAKDLLIGVVVAVAVIGGVLGVRAYLAGGAARGTLVITVSPPMKAKVLVDGKERGTLAAGAALTLKDVMPGPHRVQVQSESGRFEQKITIAANDVSVISAALQDAPALAANGEKAAPPTVPSGPAGTGRFRLNLVTEGALVFIDGAQLEEGAWRDAIPLRANVPHEFRVTKAGRDESKFSVTLKVGEEQTKSIALAAAVGRLEVKTEPAGADVNVNGRSAGQTPIKVEDIDVSKDARITIRKHGFASVTKYVSFKDDSHQALDIRLAASGSGSSSSSNSPVDEPVVTQVAPKKPDKAAPVVEDGKDKKPGADPKSPTVAPAAPDKGLPAPNANEPGFLVANTQPWAKVMIDGKDTGKTTPIAPRSKISLKPGKHVVTFVANGKKYNFDVVIKAGEDFRLIRQLDAQ